MALVRLLRECKEQLLGQRMCGLRTCCVQTAWPLANAPDAMQTVLNRIAVYAHTKHLAINTAKSEVVTSTQGAVLRCPLLC